MVWQSFTLKWTAIGGDVLLEILRKHLVEFTLYEQKLDEYFNQAAKKMFVYICSEHASDFYHDKKFVLTVDGC